MSSISAQMVRELRDATGAGMMECKKALVESGGNLEKAVEYLRVKSGVKAGKVSGRAAGEGRVAFAENNGAGVLAEVNCETDFVARGDDFGGFCQKIAELLAAADEPTWAAAQEVFAPDEEAESEVARRALVMKVGENVSFGRVRALQSGGGKIARYIHTGDKIGAIAAVEGGDENIARDICMHIAAMRPEYLSMDKVPEAEIEKERALITAETAESGKPPEVIQKMIAGRLQKHFAERVLLLQPFVKDGGKTAGEVLAENGVTVAEFRWIAVGGDAV